MSKKIFFPIILNSSCISVNCIYIILCLFCKNTFYVGETSCIKNRMHSHISTKKKFNIYYSNKNDCEIGYHFSLKRHKTANHFRLLIFYSNIEDKA